MHFELRTKKAPLNVVEAFAGIGAQMEALTRLNIECTGKIIEIEKNAVDAYQILHNTKDSKEWKNLGDITQLSVIPNCDLFTYSFPCTNISTLNPKQGFNKEDNTASSLLWACQSLIKNSQPPFLLMENVANILNTSHVNTFKEWLSFLDKMGYHSNIIQLQGYLFDVPQIRNRVFLVSSKTPFTFKDTSDCQLISQKKHGLTVYTLNRITPFKVKLNDILERNVPEKYYLSDMAVARLHRSKNQLVVKYANGINPIHSHTIHKNYHKMDGKTQQYVYDLDTQRIRRFTPRECYRLMGWQESKIDKVIHLFSDTTHYQLTGNSIIIPTLSYIFSCIL